MIEDFFRRLRGIKDKPKTGSKIQLRYTQNPKAGTAYEINSPWETASSKGQQGRVWIVAPDESGEGGFYSVRSFVNHSHRNGVSYKSLVGKTPSLVNAEKLAYRTARKLAEQIARADDAELEDLVSEDETGAEDAELAMEIDSLPARRQRHVYNRLSIFMLMTLAGIVTSVFSVQATGNVVSLLIAPPGLAGISLFIVGITGMFFHLRKL